MMTKSSKLFIIMFLILGVFVTPTLILYDFNKIANASVDNGIITDDTISDDSNAMMQSSSTSSSSSSKGSKIHVQAKKYSTVYL